MDTNYFIKKKNINRLYKNISNKRNLSKLDKQKLIKVLIKNMKNIYKNLDNTQINRKNIESVYNQFNNLCIEETEKDLNKFNQPNQQMASVKFKRDFKSQPEQQVNIMDRPVFSKNTNYQNNSLNSMYKPIISQNNDQNHIRTQNTQSLLQRLEEERNQQVINNIKPPVPDFFKTQKITKNDDNISNQTQQNNNMLAINNSNNNNFSSINDIGTTYIPSKLPEDNLSFEEKLKKIQNERIEIPPNQQTQLQPIQLSQSQQPQQLNQQQLQQQSNYKIEQFQQLEPIQSNSISHQIDSYIQQINNLNRNNNKLEEENKKLMETCQYTEQIINQYKVLKEENDNIKNTNENLADQLKFLEDQTELLNNKNLIIDQKEAKLDKKRLEINDLLKTYYSKEKKEFIQKDIVFNGKPLNFPLIKNIQSIKLVSYSLPKPIYNLLNTTLIYNIEEKEYRINIPDGLYNIETLIIKLNSLCKDIIFSLNTDQKVELKTDNIINLSNNNLTKILGFHDIKRGKHIIASHLWDLRKPNRLLLYININKNKTLFGPLYFTDTIPLEIAFKDPISLNKLDISLYDNKQNLYTFTNLESYFNFQFEVINKNTNNIFNEFM